jgi:hypothetical protein
MARVYYSPSPYEQMDEWLITPTIDCTLLTTVELDIFQYFYYYSSYPANGIIEGSTDGGATWPHMIVNQTSTQSYNWYNFDITSWAAGNNIKIRFRYLQFHATYGRYWYLGNVEVTDGTSAIFTEDFAPSYALYETSFDDVIPDSGMPPAGWLHMDWDGNGRKFICNDLASESPPNWAGYYAYVKDTSTDNIEESLITPSMNMLGLNTVRVQFDHRFDFWGPTDYIGIEIYSGGYWIHDILWYMEDVYEHVDFTFDATIYPFPFDMRIGFYYYDGGLYAEEWSIDNVDISYIPLITEYEETVLVDFADYPMRNSVGVEFPPWIPDAWQVTSEETVEYMMTADVALAGDINPANDMIGPETLALWYPFINDLGVIGIESPAGTGPAETLPVEVTVENFGQFPANAYQVNVEIGAITDESGHDQDFESTDGDYTKTGSWAWGVPTSGPGAAHSGARLWATNLNGAYPASDNAKLETVPITVPIGADLEFWMWYDTEFSWDGMNVKCSNDSGATWTILGAYLAPYDDDAASTANAGIPGEPCFSGHGQQVWTQYTFDLAPYEGEEVIIRFHFGSDSSVQYPGMYIDDVKVGTYSATFVGEYDQTVTITDQIDPDETAVITLPDWTPANLATGVSGDIRYTVIAETIFNPDMNTLNDDGAGSVELEYWHDAEIELTAPANGLGRDVLLEEGFEGVGIPTGWISVDNDADGYNWDGDWTYTPHGGAETAASASYINGIGALTPDNWLITPEIDLSDYAAAELTYWVAAQDPAYAADHIEVWVSTTGTTVPGDFTDEVDSYTESTATWKQRTVDLNAYAGETIYLAFRHTDSYDMYWIKIDDIAVTGLGGQPGGDIYIQPGVQDIEALVSNSGVFDETDVDNTAKLYQFNETGVPILIYQANITDLVMAAGTEEALDFGSYNFVDEDVYQLDIETAIAIDDYPDNNMVSLGIGVDGTAPVSTAELDPPTPSGGWYTGDVTVTLDADDGSEPWQSGVADIFYKIDGGTTMTYSDPFVISASGEHTVTYWAEDNAGNVESQNTVDVDIDTTPPTIDLTWEAGSATNEIIFTATCSDTLSGMDMVEFYINDVLQTTVTTSPYTWTMVHGPGTKYTVKAIAYDMAGNSDFDEIGSGEGTPSAQSATPLGR